MKKKCPFIRNIEDQGGGDSGTWFGDCIQGECMAWVPEVPKNVGRDIYNPIPAYCRLLQDEPVNRDRYGRLS